MSMRQWLLLLAIVLTAHPVRGDEPLTPQEAIAKIELLRGKIEREVPPPGSSTPAEPAVLGIDFGGSQRLGDGFLFLLQPFPDLKRLELDDTRVTATGLGQLGGLTSLTRLSLRNLDIGDDAVRELRAHKKLRELDLTGTKVTDAGRAELRESLPELWIIDEAESIRELEAIDGIIERHQSRPGRPVRSLRFQRNHELTARHRRMLLAFEHLEDLDLDLRSELSRADFEGLRRFPELTRLRLTYTHIDDVGMKSVGTLTRLKSLRLLGCRRITDRGLKELRNLEALTELDLYDCPLITDAGLAELAHFKQLGSLTLGDQEITEAGISHLVELPALKRLSLENCPKLGDPAVKELGKMTGLTSLDLWQASITDVGVGELKRLTELTWLHLGGTAITAVGLEELRPLDRLEVLSLNKTRLTPAGYKRLGTFQNLKHLYLGDTDITDKDLKELVPLLQLKELSLNDCQQITAAGLREFAGHPSLKTLGLRRTRITEQQRNELQGALPGIQLQ